MKKIEQLKIIIKRHHKKKIKGKLYWYYWESGKWYSKGPASDGDPRNPYFKEIVRTKRILKKLDKKIMSIVTRKYGDHLVVDMSLFKRYMTKDLPDELIPIRKILGRNA